MSQSKTSWTRLFHSPVGFVQDVPYSELLSSWLLASEKYLSLTRRTQRKDDCKISSNIKKKKKPIRNVPLSLYIPYGLGQEYFTNPLILFMSKLY